MSSVIARFASRILAPYWRSVLYRPTRLAWAELHALANESGWALETVSVASDVSLVGLVRRPEDPEGPWLMFFGGNAMDLKNSKQALKWIAGDIPCGLAVFAYRGYDGSGGTPIESALHEDAERLVDHLRSATGFRNERLILVGQSLGTGVAMRLAAREHRAGRTLGGLVLISPYTSMAAVVGEHVPWLPVAWSMSERFDSISDASDVGVPVLIVHGLQDTLISPRHARAIKAAIGSKAQLVELEGRGHRDMWLPNEPMVGILGRFVASRVSSSS